MKMRVSFSQGWTVAARSAALGVVLLGALTPSKAGRPLPPQPAATPTPAPAPVPLAPTIFDIPIDAPQQPHATINLSSPPESVSGGWWDASREAIGQRCRKLYLKTRQPVQNGVVQVQFQVFPTGEVKNIRVVEAKAKPWFSALCYRAVKETPLTPPPPEALEQAKAVPFEQVIRFTMTVHEL